MAHEARAETFDGRPKTESEKAALWFKRAYEIAQERDEAVRLLREFGSCDPYTGQPYDEVVAFLARFPEAE